MFSKKFIRATEDFSTLEHFVPNPYFRRSFQVDASSIKAVKLTICGLGFYKLYINGSDITKGFLAPYISAPSQLVYYDTYDITESMRNGENVIGVLLGNGIQNNPGRWIWGFSNAPWRGYLRLAIAVEIQYQDGSVEVFEGDDRFKVHNSPIINEDFYNGEYYDARLEIPGWNLPGYDDSQWKPAQIAERPMGKITTSEAEPILVQYDLHPLFINREEKGYVYDFGYNCAGLCSLKIRNTKPGQKIILHYGEMLLDGKFSKDNVIQFDDKPHLAHFVHKDIYYCKGAELEEYMPSFTYHGFQYVLVEGLEKEQAVPELLTYHVINSDIDVIGGFTCSDPCANALQDMVIRSNLSNMHYFPTDCPTREKNGWTGDAALSGEQFALNLKLDNSLREWFKNIRASQLENGGLAGIVPTPGWPEEYPGPSWDIAIVLLPYYMYIYRGDERIVRENANMMFQYLSYMSERISEKGTINYGYGDWVQAGTIEAGVCDAPVDVVSTASAIDLCEKAAFLFRKMHMDHRAEYAESMAADFRKAFRKNFIDPETCIVAGDCQTSQCVGLYYNLFNEEEKPKAFAHLMELVKKYDNHIHVGILGGRLIFHTLAMFGEYELAYDMITCRDYPGYGHLYDIGSTTMWEGFIPEGVVLPYSRNHHFWGDISHWFIRHIGGICVNPNGENPNSLDIRPHFIKQLDYAEAKHTTPFGQIVSSWKREGNQVILKITAPASTGGYVYAPDGYIHEIGKKKLPLVPGEYILVEGDRRI